VRIEESFTVTRPPDETFQYLADIEHEPRWNPWAIEVTKVTSGPIGPGSRFRGRYKRFGVVEQELADYVPSRRITYRSNTMGAASMTFELQPNASSTRITLTGQADPPGLMKLLDPVMGLMMRGHFRDLVEGLKRELQTVSPKIGQPALER
jgi:uncharacterized protein YndB with AHSA1/START domain